MSYQQWLVKMLCQPGRKAQPLALFDLLQQWVDAPGFRQGLLQELQALPAEEPLLDLLAQQAADAGCDDAPDVARQVYFLALGALQAELRQPGCGALSGARRAAAILLAPPRHRRPAARMAIAAALAALCILPLLQPEQTGPATTARPPAAMPALQQASFSPDQRFALHQTLEKLQQGVCQYPQALMLPPEQRPVLIENVVNGEPSASRQRLQLAQQLAQSVDCYYAPIAMTM